MTTTPAGSGSAAAASSAAGSTRAGGTAGAARVPGPAGSTDPGRRGDLIGYARVSTDAQDVALQHDALTAAGCARIYTDHASGALTERPQLSAALDYLRPRDTLIVWRLDRLGRSLPHLLSVTADLAERGVGFASLTEALDTTSPGGRLVFHIFAAIAEFERDLIRGRTLAGLAAARARGRIGGRPVKMTPAKAAIAAQMRTDGHPAAVIAEVLGVSRPTVYRHLRDALPPVSPAPPAAAPTAAG